MSEEKVKTDGELVLTGSQVVKVDIGKVQKGCENKVSDDRKRQSKTE